MFGTWLNSHARVGNIPSLTGKDGETPATSANSRGKPVAIWPPHELRGGCIWTGDFVYKCEGLAGPRVGPVVWM